MGQILIVSHYNGLVLTAAQYAIDGSPVIATRFDFNYTPQQVWQLRDRNLICLANYQAAILTLVQGDAASLTITTHDEVGDNTHWQLTAEGYLINPSSGLMVVLAPGSNPDRVALTLSATVPTERDTARWLLGAPLTINSAIDGAQIGILNPEGPQGRALAAYKPLIQPQPPAKTWLHTPDGYLINLETSLFLTSVPGADGSSYTVAALPRTGAASQQWTTLPDGPIFSRGAVGPSGQIWALTAQSINFASSSLLMRQYSRDASLPPEARWSQVSVWSAPSAEPPGAPFEASDFKWERPLEGSLIDWCQTDGLLCTLTAAPGSAAVLHALTLGTGDLVQALTLPIPPEILRVSAPQEGIIPGRPLNPSQPRVMAPLRDQLALALAPADLTAPPQIALLDPRRGTLTTLATLPDAHMVLWLAADDDTLYIFTDPNVYALTTNGQLISIGSLSPWIDGLRSPTGAPLALFTGLTQGGNFYLAGASQFGGFSVSRGSVSAWRLTPGTSQMLWATSTTVMSEVSDEQISALLADSATLYWSTGLEVRAVDLHSGADRWKVAAAENEQFVGLALNAGKVYVTERDTGVRAYASASGQLGTTLAFRETPLARPLVADGVLYTFSPHYVYAADLSYSDETLEIPLSVTSLLAADSDTVYMADESSIYAQDFMEVIREFCVDSVLIQDFVALDPAQPQNLSRLPVYQIAITLYDDARLPRGDEPVKIWALEQTTITANGTSYSIDTTTSITIVTGPDGKLIIEIPAQGITTPALLLWAPFMPANEQIVIYPDHSVHTTLGTLTGDNLDEARDYDGNAILDQTYRGTTTPEAAQARNAVASAVNALATIVNNARQAPIATTTAPTRYLAPNAVSKGAHHLPSLAQLAVPLVSPVSWMLDLTTGGMFQQLAYSEVINWKSRHPVSADHGADDLWMVLQSGAATLLNAVVDATEGLSVIVTTLSAGVQTIYHALIDSVEKAATLIGACFQKLGATTKQALEWLSYIFDWQSILDMHTQIVTTISSSLGTLVSSGYLDAFQTQIGTLLDQWKGNVSTLFNSARASLGEASFNSYPSAQPSNALLDGARAQTTGAREGWLTNKVVRHNLSATSAPPAGDDLFDLSPVVASAQAFWSTLESKVSADVQAKLAQFTSGFAQMSASTFLQGSVATALTGVELVIDVVLDFAEAVLDAMFSLLKELIVNNVLLDGLQQEIHLPFITDFYRYITRTPENPQGSPMTALDMIALLIAIPASALAKIWSELDPDPQASANVLGGSGQTFPHWWTLGASAATLVYARIDFFLELSGEKLPKHIQGIFGVGLPALILSMQLVDIVRSYVGNIEASAMINLPNLCTMVLDLIALKFSDEQQLARYNYGYQWALCVIGGINAAVILAWSINRPSLRTWDSITTNLISTMLLLIKPVRQIPRIGPVTGVEVVAVADAVLTSSVAIVGFVATLPTLPSGQSSASGGMTKRDGAPAGPALLSAPVSAPSVNSEAPWPAGTSEPSANVRYAYRFYTASWESPASPWSLPCPIRPSSSGQRVEVHLGTEPLGLASGRRIYRQLAGGATELIAQIEDNTTTIFSDTL